MTDKLINHERLLENFNCKSKATLEKTLRSQKVRFLYGDGGKLVTTVDAINAAMGLQAGKVERVDIEFRR